MRSLFRTFVTSNMDPVVAKALPVGAAVAAYGISYGVLAVAAGLSPLLATLSSVIVLAGGSQFAFVGVLAAGGHPFAGALSGLLLNLRYVAFGFAIAPHLTGASVARRAADGYMVVDESVALGLAGDPHGVRRRFRTTAWTVIIAWIGATALGAYGGQLIGDPELLGLDAAFPAGFLALLAPWLRRTSGRTAALAGAAVAIALTPFTPPGVPIIAAGLAAFVALPLLRREEPATVPDEPTAGPDDAAAGPDDAAAGPDDAAAGPDDAAAGPDDAAAGPGEAATRSDTTTGHGRNDPS